MHFHLPKPLHGWRAFAGEVGIIVVGVLIALGAEQVVENWHWREKVRAAERSLDFEVNVQLDNAEGAVALNRCSAAWFGTLETAILAHDTATIQRLYAAHPPYEERAWRSTAWQAAMSTQVADHIDAIAMAQYGFLYNGTEEARERQRTLIADSDEATMGRLGDAGESSTALQLAAAERLRGELRDMKAISAGMLLAARGGIHPGWKPLHRVRAPHLDAEIRSELQSCETAASSAHGRRG
jgi:hypothetical protein